jgi:hypothetical protein
VVALVALFGVPALADIPAQPAPGGTDSPGMDTVKVETRAALERQISGYVSSITVPHLDESQSRWNNRLHEGHVNYPICAHVLGLDPNYGKFMTERLWRIAKDAGALVRDKPDCEPINFWVVVTAQPGKVLDELWEKFPRLFDDRRGVAPLKHLIATDQPVRVWYNVLNGRGALGTRLQWNTLREIYSVVVAVDAARITDLTIGQLTDYVAMVGLVRIREDADPGDTPTIIRLFAEDAAHRPEGLSSWDQAFLKALYDSDANNVGQIDLIKDRLYRSLTSAP